MKKLIFIPLLLLSACATPQPNADLPALRAEQTLTIALATVDTALRFESQNRSDVPEKIQQAADEVRKRAAKAFTTADDVRLAYKRGQATESKLLLAITLVEELVVQVKWWSGESAASMAGRSPTEMILLEAEVSASDSPAAWAVAIPIFINLAKEVYAVVNDVRGSLRQDMQWSPAQDAEFRSKLMTTITQPHWRN
jgi:hypothetical protein